MQWRSDAAGKFSHGVYVGYSDNGIKPEATTSFEIVFPGGATLGGPDGLAPVPDIVSSGTATAKTKLSNSYDLLYIFSWNKSARIKPFAMFGYSQTDFTGKSITNSEFMVTDSGGPRTDNSTSVTKIDDTLRGYKFAIGSDYIFADNWVASLAVEYIDYGKEKIGIDISSRTQREGEMETFGVGKTSSKAEFNSTGLQFGIAYRF